MHAERRCVQCMSMCVMCRRNVEQELGSMQDKEFDALLAAAWQLQVCHRGGFWLYVKEKMCPEPIA